MSGLIKRMISVLIATSLFFNCCVISFAAESPKLTEEEVLAEILNNTATVTHEVRPLDSFTDEEISQRPDLQHLFDEINKPETCDPNQYYIFGDVYTTHVVTSNNQTVVYTSLPKVYFTVVDVGIAGSSDINSNFTIIESVSVDGNYNLGWQNAIIYKDLSAAMGCGANTVFTSNVLVDGNDSGTFSLDILGIFGLITSNAGYTTANQILDALGTITYSGSSASSKTLYTTNIRAVGAKYDDSELFSDQHFLYIDSSISSKDSTLNEQVTSAAFEWEYDVYFFAGSLQPVYRNETISADIEYVCNKISQ